jgi:lysophospholipase L1-like esterase
VISSDRVRAILAGLALASACGTEANTAHLVAPPAPFDLLEFRFDAPGCYPTGSTLGVNSGGGIEPFTIVRSTSTGPATVTDAAGTQSCPAGAYLMVTGDGAFIPYDGGVGGRDYSFPIPAAFGAVEELCVNVEAIGWLPNRPGGGVGYSTWGFAGTHTLWSMGAAAGSANSLYQSQPSGGSVPMAVTSADATNAVRTYGLLAYLPVSPNQGALGATVRTFTTTYNRTTGTIRTYLDGLPFGTQSGTGTGILGTAPPRVRIGYNGTAGQWGGFVRRFRVAASDDMTSCYSPAGADRTVIALGDSHTTSNGASTADLAFPWILQVALGSEWRVRNHGKSGDKVQTMRETRWPALRTDVAGWLVLEAGLNDITKNTTRTAPEVCADAQAIAEDAISLGKRVVIVSLQSCEGTLSCDATTETRRTAVNQCLIDYVATRPGQVAWADTAEIVDGPGCATTGPCSLLPAYDSGDHSHLNDAGTQVFRDTVLAAMETLGYVPAPTFDAFSVTSTLLDADPVATITWSTTGATSVSITGLGSVDPDGTATVALPAGRTDVTITASNAGGTRKRLGNATVSWSQPTLFDTEGCWDNGFSGITAATTAGRSCTVGGAAQTCRLNQFCVEDNVGLSWVATNQHTIAQPLSAAQLTAGWCWGFFFTPATSWTSGTDLVLSTGTGTQTAYLQRTPTNIQFDFHSTGASSPFITGAHGLTGSAEHEIVACVDGTGAASVYVDGVLKASAGANSAGIITEAKPTLGLGNHPGSGAGSAGRIRHFKACASSDWSACRP